MPKLDFQYCPKLAVFDRDRARILLCRRKGEQDYDGTYSLIGGKMEHSDPSILAAVKREKDEEVGHAFKVRIYDKISVDVNFGKKDGSRMILPHYYCEYLEGNVVLSDEYSDYRWVPLDELFALEPMIDNIRWIAPLLKKVSTIAQQEDFEVI